MKNFFIKLYKAVKKYFYNPKWRCLACGKEIFEGNFCADCQKELPFNDGIICEHCGRKVIGAESYCSTCKGILVSLDKCRSAFNYAPPISTLIKKMKYDNGRFIAEAFSEYLAPLYFKNYFNADFITFIPMTDKAKKKRGYNQGELLAEETSKRVGLPVVVCLKKVKDTDRQAKLGRKERFENLTDAYRVISRKAVKDKKILIIDDVTTTGATAQVAAEKLKRAGAKNVYLLSVASVPPIDKY